MKISNLITWLKRMLKMDIDKPISIRPGSEPSALDPTKVVQGSRLQRQLDDICIKHHGMLPCEDDDDILW